MPLWGWLLFVAFCVAVPLTGPGRRFLRAYSRLRHDRRVRDPMERAILLSIYNQPDQIHLQATAKPAWREPVEIDAPADALRSAGLVDAGAFGIREWPSTTLWLWVHEAERFYAAITQSKESVHVDVIAWFTDGRHETYSNYPTESGVRRAPTAPLRRFGGVNAADLVARFRADCPRDGRVALTPADAPALFERHWSEYMKWRRANRPELEELHAIAASIRARRAGPASGDRSV